MISADFHFLCHGAAYLRPKVKGSASRIQCQILCEKNAMKTCFRWLKRSQYYQNLFEHCWDAAYLRPKVKGSASHGQNKMISADFHFLCHGAAHLRPKVKVVQVEWRTKRIHSFFILRRSLPCATARSNGRPAGKKWNQLKKAINTITGKVV